MQPLYKTPAHRTFEALLRSLTLLHCLLSRRLCRRQLLSGPGRTAPAGRLLLVAPHQPACPASGSAGRWRDACSPATRLAGLLLRQEGTALKVGHACWVLRDEAGAE